MIYMKLTNFWSIFIVNEIRWLELRAIALALMVSGDKLSSQLLI